MKEKEFIMEHDYCFYFDADMRIDGLVTPDEVCGDLVATRHGYQSLASPAQQSFDRNPKSVAYVAPSESTVTYYAGGFNGGRTENFMAMSEKIANNVNTDLLVSVLLITESHK